MIGIPERTISTSYAHGAETGHSTRGPIRSWGVGRGTTSSAATVSSDDKAGVLLMNKPEDIYSKCPFCGRDVLNTEDDDLINKWVEFHIRDRGCVS